MVGDEDASGVFWVVHVVVMMALVRAVGCPPCWRPVVRVVPLELFDSVGVLCGRLRCRRLLLVVCLPPCWRPVVLQRLFVPLGIGRV